MCDQCWTYFIGLAGKYFCRTCSFNLQFSVREHHMPSASENIVMASMWNFAPQWLKHISAAAMFMATKLVMVVTCLEMIPHLKSHELLITWSCKITWQTKINISSLPQCLWSPILSGLWFTLRRSYLYSHMTLKSRGVARSYDKIKRSPLPQCPWPPNLAEWWHAMMSSHSWSHASNQSRGLVRSCNELSTLYLHLH